MSSIIKPEDITMDTLRYLEKDSFALWALNSGITVDGRKLEFEKHKYLLPIYLDNSKHIVLIKAAQLGATVYQLLRLIWFLVHNQGTKAGIYFPVKSLADDISKDRLAPMLESNPDIYKLTDPGDKLALRKIGSSSLYFMYLEGKSTRDSVPLDYLSFDEVRLSNQASIDATQERIAHSDYKYRVFMSTCGLPNSDIDRRYQNGRQYVWHSRCNCSDGVDLARAFPDCIVDDPKRGVYLICPKCRWVIKDPQNGRYIAHNPGASYNSYSVSQLASKFISPAEIWDFYKTTTNISEFYNSKLGLPWVDEESRGVSLDQLGACVDDDLEWKRPSQGEVCAMGVDQGAGYVMAIIGNIMPNGKKRLRHIEVIESDNPRYYVNGRKVSPFVRLGELMKEFNVHLCVVDAMPNSNDAMAFAQDFRTRVFLAWYQRDAKDTVQWGDKKRIKETTRKAGTFLKFKYTVTLSRYMSLGAMLGAWANGAYVTPPVNELVQICRDESTKQFIPVSLGARTFDHLCRLIRQFRVINDETGEGKHEWIYTGGDPHLAHAMNYLNVGLERLGRRAQWTFA